MGMSRQEIKSKFDQIVDFSEVEKFLDTPVKHYSSGMQMRLAFSVAAHLTPDILILDEVLSVGDYKFQQKSLKRMEEINNSGCTVIFVSHSIDAIQKYCKRAILLSDGKIMMDSDDMDLALDLYTKM
jgi:lipopolysaccharide transport system ATP-binding protein